MVNYVEPLEAARWFQRVGVIASGGLDSVENALRHASHLLQLTPRPLRPVIGPSTDEETFEALLESGDFDGAARRLVARPTALVVEDAEGAVAEATIHCSVLNRQSSGMGETVAIALLDAWTTCLLAFKTEYGEDLAGLGREAIDKNSIEQDPTVRAFCDRSEQRKWSDTGAVVYLRDLDPGQRLPAADIDEH